MERPTLRQLEYFVALFEKLSFRQAAEACHVSQPALSAQIAQLESLVGFELFERGPGGVRNTRAAETLLPQAREALRSVQRFGELAQSLGQPLSGPLRMGVIPTVGPYLLPKVLPAVHRAFPDLRLFLREDMTSSLVAQLASGALDLLLLAIDVDLPGLATLPLFSDPFLLAVPEGDALAGAETASESDLEGRTLLLLEEGHCLREQTLPLCEASGGSELGGFRASSLATIAQMVASGIGITLLPELAVERELAAAPGLRVLPFGAGGPARQVGLAWRARSPRAEEFGALGERLGAAYAAR